MWMCRKRECSTTSLVAPPRKVKLEALLQKKYIRKKNLAAFRMSFLLD